MYATFGTERVFREPPLAEVVVGLRDLAVNLIVTIGRHGDPSLFGAQPANVYIERYIPQSLLLPHCAAVVTHGGWNTMIQSLSFGLPTVVIPMGNGQEDQADRLEAVGAGLRISNASWTPQAIRDAMNSVMQDREYREQAQRLRREGDALPGLESAVDLIERLAVEQQPLFGHWSGVSR
ncbi:MAG: glycosyltransferase [Chloroflexota bacterium]